MGSLQTRPINSIDKFGAKPTVGLSHQNMLFNQKDLSSKNKPFLQRGENLDKIKMENNFSAPLN